MKNTILKSMVALLMLWGTTACTDDVLVEVEQPGMENITPETGRITSLKNILPQGKPGYDGVDSRNTTTTTTEWANGDELLLKVEIKSDETVAYTAWMTLVYDDDDNDNDDDNDDDDDNANPFWYIKEDEDAYFAQKTGSNVVTVYETLPLVTPNTGIILNGTGANFEAIIPEEISGKNLLVSMFYAPDLEWKENNNEVALRLKENPSTYAPEFWEVKNNEWSTDLARVCVNTGTAGDVVTLNSTSFEPLSGYKKSSDGIYTATTVGPNGIAYFYGIIDSEITSGFQINLVNEITVNNSTVNLDPTVLYEASTLNKIKFEAGISYSVDVCNARNAAVNEKNSLAINGYVYEDNTFKVINENGLQAWLNKVKTNSSVNLILEHDVEFTNQGNTQIPSSNSTRADQTTETPNADADLQTPGAQVLNGIKDESGNEFDKISNWESGLKHIDSNDFTKSTLKPYTGVIDGKGHTIKGLRIYSTTDFSGFIDLLRGGTIKNIVFENAIVVSTNDVTGIVVGVNQGGTISNCTVKNSTVFGAGSIGGIVGKNVSGGKVLDCINENTKVIGNSGWAGGIVGEISSSVDKAPGASDNDFAVHTTHNRFEEVGDYMGGIVSGCTNSGIVEGRTPKPSIGSTGGIVGAVHLNGIVKECMNSGKVKNKVSDSNGGNVGGIVGHNSGKVVACGNIGIVEDGLHIGGLIGTNYLNGDVKGEIYGSWTHSTYEKNNGTDSSTKTGIGNDIQVDTKVDKVFYCKVYANYSNISVDDLNLGITSYNNLSGVEKCTKQWQVTSGSWPTLTPITNP